MFIEELIIDGFKSYSTRTSVGPFDQQFNAITGLNGSGKSNILDSICFVLGITNLSHVRVGNLSELVYKQGQAGVTKASVTVVFNNQDKSCSPVGYEAHDRIHITRQIVIGGRNRYLLNSHTVQANQIQNLFHSVSLNVNNPHFLIMQGRITKVINMKPQETLSMIEEAAGTRMYENKKISALKTMEKKQNKVDEINRLLAEEITPTLDKLQKERSNYMQWVSLSNEIEILQRFCVAFEYTQAQERLTSKNKGLEEMENSLVSLARDITNLQESETRMTKELQDKIATRDGKRARDLKQLEENVSKVSKELALTESKLTNRESDLKTHVEGRQKGQKHLDELRAQVAKKEAAYLKEKSKFDQLEGDEASVKKAIEKAQWSVQALTAGMSTKASGDDAEGEGKSLREELLALQTEASTLEADEKKKQLEIAHLTERITVKEGKLGKSRLEGKKLVKEKLLAESLVEKKRSELECVAFDPQAFAKALEHARESELALQSLQERADALRAFLGGIDFHYADPHKGFKRSVVKGVVAKLFTISPDFSEYHRALEVCAGGRLFFVVVDNEETGRALLERGQLQRRVTIIPLNKVVDQSIRPDVVKTARKIAPADSGLYPALQIIGFEKQVQNAMKFVFGGHLVCDTPETAKQVTFHPNVMVRSVTKDGDVYDPAGTLTGGSAPKGGGLLLKLQELSQLEQDVQAQQIDCAQKQAELDGLKSAATHHMVAQQDLQCKEHEASLIQERIAHSEFHTSERVLKEIRDEVASLEAELKAMPDARKRLQNQMRQMEKDIRNLEYNREDRIRQFEKQVEDLTASLKGHAEKLEKHRGKTEEVSVEYEVIRAELASHESVDETTDQQHRVLLADVEKLRATFDEQKSNCEVMNASLESLKEELSALDATVTQLTSELTSNKTRREELELEQKKVGHRAQQLQKDDEEVHTAVARMEQEHPWLEHEQHLFGKEGADFDFKAKSYPDHKKKLDAAQAKQKSVGKNINKKAMAMFDRAEQEYQELTSKRDIILNDKRKIEAVIGDLDEKKQETLRRTWMKVNKDFHSIFSALLPNASAKLEAPQGMSETEGLEIKVAFGSVWKNSLSELSGGQRSLLSLSLVLALLLFKPAPMYILDEIDSALDLSHTQNIGHMIRTHFPHSQFIVVSLKEGMFNNANVLFRTRFIDGTSTVARYAIRDGEDHIDVPEEEERAQCKKRKAVARVKGA